MEKERKWYENWKSQLQQNAVIPCSLIGASSFSCSIALSTLIQHRILNISTATKAPIPTLVGMTTVAFSSLFAHICATSSHETLKSKKISNLFSFRPILQAQECMIPNILKPYSNYKSNKSIMICQNIQKPAIQIVFLGLLSFQVFGGRYWTISPSSYTHLGSFARIPFSLPASVDKYATPSQRLAIEKLGRRYGCHTCGARKIVSSISTNVQNKIPLSQSSSNVQFHADHMPPNAIVKQYNQRLWRKILNYPMKQRFYPQCITCSGKQGQILSKGTNLQQWMKKGGISWKHELSYCHATRTRLHTILTGALLGTVAALSEDE